MNKIKIRHKNCAICFYMCVYICVCVCACVFVSLRSVDCFACLGWKFRTIAQGNTSHKHTQTYTQRHKQCSPVGSREQSCWSSGSALCPRDRDVHVHIFLWVMLSCFIWIWTKWWFRTRVCCANLCKQWIFDTYCFCVSYSLKSGSQPGI